MQTRIETKINALMPFFMYAPFFLKWMTFNVICFFREILLITDHVVVIRSLPYRVGAGLPALLRDDLCCFYFSFAYILRQIKFLFRWQCQKPVDMVTGNNKYVQDRSGLGCDILKYP